MKAARFAWGRMIQTVAVGLVLLAGVASAKVLGPEIERYLLPGTIGPYSIVERIDNSDGTISIRFKARRLRLCARLDSQWYALHEGAWRRVKVEVAGLPVVRPNGWNTSPLNTLPGPGYYRLHVDYDCGWPWRSYVEMGPFDLRTPA